jgi:hypothetical protein
MKIDRVILSSNENINYYPFWNPLSRVYKENFGITPTLIWFGKESDIHRLELSNKYGDIIVQDTDERFKVGWQTTWSLFYYTKFFPDDVITIMGIDQVPLSNMFLGELIKDCKDDEYVMLIDDAYKPIYWENINGTSPSAYHIAKGKIFNKVYKFEDNFYKEIEKVYNDPVERDFNPNCAFWQSGEEKWGLDESYSSKKLREYRKNGGNIRSMSKFNLLSERRIECYRHIETSYNDDLLKSGYYSESHLCRPYTNHINYIDRMISLIPKYI